MRLVHLPQMVNFPDATQAYVNDSAFSSSERLTDMQRRLKAVTHERTSTQSQSEKMQASAACLPSAMTRRYVSSASIISLCTHPAT